ncbi:MAG: hydrogenase nickel incorporation protein HypB [Planctomycetota bacterium]
MSTSTVPVVENVLKLNDEIAAMNRVAFRAANVRVVNLIGGPGCGKTTLLERTARRFTSRGLRLGVIVGDLATTRDAERLIVAGAKAVQINTGKGCHLDANQVRNAVDQLDLLALDLLIIENVGNLICPVGFDLGHDEMVGMFSVAEGDDKPAKHPHLVHTSSVLLLNKSDLLPHVPFDERRFRADVAALNAQAPIWNIAAAKDEISPWLEWIDARLPSPAD